MGNYGTSNVSRLSSGSAIWKKLFKKDPEKKGNFKEIVAKLSRGLMLPIAMLPIAGLFLGIGNAIATNSPSGSFGAVFGNFLQQPGGAIFGALPLLFAIAIAIAFTNDAGPAALSTLVGFLAFSGLQAGLIEPVNASNGGGLIGYNLLFYRAGSLGSVSPIVNGVGAGLPTALFGSVIGILQLQSSVFGGFVVGFIVAYFYKKYKDIKLPVIFGFFNGIRFVPIVTFLAFIPITLIFLVFWPLIGVLLNIIGSALGQALGFNSFIFGYIERALVPFGLHHAFYSPLWYSQAGGFINLNAQAVIARENQFYAVFATRPNMVNGNSMQPALVTWDALIKSLNPELANTTINQTGGDQVLWAFFNANLVGKTVYLVPAMETQAQTVTDPGMFSIATNAASNGTNGIVESHLKFTDLTSPFAALNAKGANGFFGVNIGQYLQGKYVFMITGLPAAAVAMVYAAPKENRKFASSVILSAGATSMLTGITEPIEFTFLFLAPWLFWGVHAFFCALAFGLMNWIGLALIASGHGELAPHIGQSFSGGLLDWVIFGGIQIQYGSNAWWSWIFGLAYIPIYFFLFYFLIKKFNIPTPGREGGATKLYTKADFQAKNAANAAMSSELNLTQPQIHALNVVGAYGGFDNLKNVDACITKLRIQVANQDIVDQNKLVQLGAKGVMKPSAQSVYAIFGVEADIIKGNIKVLMEKLSQEPSLKQKWDGYINGSNTSSQTETASNQQTTQENSFANETLIIKSPIDGVLIKNEEIPDDTFSKSVMGYTLAIKPTGEEVVSPFDGKTTLVYPTNHAYVLESTKGTQVLIHIGIDSFSIKDKEGNELKPFTPLVDADDELKTGKTIAKIDLKKLKNAKSIVTPIVVMQETMGERTFKVKAKYGPVKKGDVLLEIKPKEKKN